MYSKSLANTNLKWKLEFCYYFFQKNIQYNIFVMPKKKKRKEVKQKLNATDKHMTHLCKRKEKRNCCRLLTNFSVPPNLTMVTFTILQTSNPNLHTHAAIWATSSNFITNYTHTSSSSLSLSTLLMVPSSSRSLCY